MGFSDAVKTCFAKYADFKGRAMRSEYWWWVLFMVLASFVFGILDAVTFGGGPDDTGVLGSIFSLATFLPALAVTARRLHDCDQSGWWQVGPLGLLILAAVLAGFDAMILFWAALAGGIATSILVLVWLIRKGTDGPNRFGPDPLGGADGTGHGDGYRRSPIPNTRND